MKTVLIEPQHKKRAADLLPDVDAAGLAARLHRKLKGEVRFDDGNRALYSTDASNYRQVPIGVVIPRDVEDVVETMAACREYGAPVLSRGGGTSLAGQCCNVAVVLDFTKYMNRVVEVDAGKRLARVQPGCVFDDVRSATLKQGLNFGPDPATHSHCAIGGMLGNNSCGIHSLLSVKHGRGMRTSDNTEEMEVLTYEGHRFTVGPTSETELERLIQRGGAKGEIYARLKSLRDRYAGQIRDRFPRVPRRVSGYSLDELLPEHDFHVARSLVGSEGTCVTILEATLHLVPNPGSRSLLVLGYPDVYSAADHLTEILEFDPTGLEGMDDLLVRWLRQQGNKRQNLELLPPGNGWLLVEFGGETSEEATAQARRCMKSLKNGTSAPAMRLFETEEEQHMVWKVRESGLGATAWQPGHPDNWPGFEDSAVPPERVAGYLRDLKELMGKYGFETSLYGHFGQGCIHCRIGFDLYTAEGVEQYRSFMEEATDLVVHYGGSISGEHGDGQARGEFLPKIYGEDLMQAFREFKRIWDPHWKMNPGKVIDANPATSDLRLGPDYNPPNPLTHFKYPGDQGTFARAALRCVGIGECRKLGGQTMCPSYMVTLEEMHSTRGRARLLWEMLNGNVLKGGWRNESVREALDLCLSCKGCKGDCPVNVDMATYKAEFLSRYYEGRIRPRHMFAFGLIHYWARFASLAPALVNMVNRAPGLNRLVKWALEVAQQRTLPRFAPETFKAWFARRPSRNVGLPRVILFADTFNNFLQPEVAQAAVEVLEDAGFQVCVPRDDLCCGRPLFDYGMLDLAERWLQQILKSLRQEIEAGTPMVVLEPSCWATFRDELTNLFPNDLDAQRLSKNTFSLGQFLLEKAASYQLPELLRRIIVHGHCHQKALKDLEYDLNALKKMGLEVEVLDSGCCGMAGAFGYEHDHYDVSIACGERVLLPAVRDARLEHILLADGFSCREQIQQGTRREALHLAQIIQLAKHSGPDGPAPGQRAEAAYVWMREAEHRRANLKTAAVLGGLAVAVYAAWKLFRHRKGGNF